MVQWYFLFIGDTEGKDFAPPTSDNISKFKCFMIFLATVMRFIKKGFINHLVQNPIEDTTEHAIHEHELLYVYILLG